MEIVGGKMKEENIYSPEPRIQVALEILVLN